MCGIAGMIDLSGRKRRAPAGAVERMAAAIVHRGPDEGGFLERPGLHLAIRRLSIVGLADGQQPISNEDGTVWTVFNGEFFDYPERRKLLEAKGHTFRTHTDTELIPHSWEEYREKFFDHLYGQFAFCLLDERTGEIVLGRDRAGIGIICTRGRPRVASAWRKGSVMPLPSVNTATASAGTAHPGGPASCTTRRAMAGAGSIHATGQGARRANRSDSNG